MQRQQLSLDESKWLTTIFRSNGFYKTEVVSEKEKQDNAALTLGFIGTGLLDEKEYKGRRLVAFTNRGLAHLVVDARVPFKEVFETFRSAMGEIEKEVAMKRRNLESDEELDILYRETFKKYLEYDLFDEANDFSTAWHMNPKQIGKLALEIMLEVLKDERFSVKSVGRSLGWPDKVLEMVTTRDSCRSMIKQALEMF